jgi:hypothetical protein
MREGFNGGWVYDIAAHTCLQQHGVYVHSLQGIKDDGKFPLLPLQNLQLK